MVLHSSLPRLTLTFLAFAAFVAACSSTATSGRADAGLTSRDATSTDAPSGSSGGVPGAGGASMGGASASGGSGSTCVSTRGSCAGGESCCAGLSCCAGVPVPPGTEYCSDTCPRSDRNLKRDFSAVDPDAILERVATLPITTWSYKTERGDVRHMGPMAQDFMAAFGLGASDKTILQVDADGVALASIQAIHRRLLALEEENRRLQQEVERLQGQRTGFGL